MKLRTIIESEYAGLEDADEFEDNGDHYCTDCNSYANFCDVCDNDWCDCAGDRPTVETDDVEDADINQCSVCGQWFCRECGGKFDHPLLDYVTNLCGPCARESTSTPIEESNEYAGLEDADEFEDENSITILHIDDDFVKLFQQYHEGQADPLYGVVSRSVTGMSRHQEWTGERPADGYPWPKVLTLNDDEYDAIVSVARQIVADQANTASGRGPLSRATTPTEGEIAKKYLDRLGERVDPNDFPPE